MSIGELAPKVVKITQVS